MLIIQLEKNEKLPDIEFSQKGCYHEICPDCKKDFVIFFHEMGRKWLYGKCQCGYITHPDLINYLQPDHKAFKMIYGNDPFADTAKRKREMEWNKEKEKELLEKKYNYIFKNKEERDLAKKIVLKEEHEISGLQIK